MLVIGAPADLPRAINHPAVVQERFILVATVAIDPDDPAAPALDQFTHLLDQVDGVLVAGLLGHSVMRQLTDAAMAHGRSLLAVMPTDVLHVHDPVIVWHADAPLVQLTAPARHPWRLVAKRGLDIVGSSLGLIVCAPVLAVLAAIVRIESRGAPIFRHARVGHRGRTFQCLKLRTMRADSEQVLRNDATLYDEYVRNHYKIPEHRDPRITRMGRLLRRTSLDELPQLWNVLLGDMSLVGPRPVVKDELAHYGDRRDLVLSVRPGITGAWAVNGRQNVGYPERCDIELGYVRSWSLRRDVGILLRTVAVVASPLTGRGASASGAD